MKPAKRFEVEITEDGKYITTINGEDPRLHYRRTNLVLRLIEFLEVEQARYTERPDEEGIKFSLG